MRGPQRPTSPWGGWCTCTTAPSCTHGQSSRSAAPQSCPAWCCRWREEWPFFDSPEFARVLAQPWVVKRSKEQEETMNFSPVCTHCCFSTACTLKWGWGNVSCHCSVNKREFRGPLSAVIHKWHPAFKEIQQNPPSGGPWPTRGPSQRQRAVLDCSALPLSYWSTRLCLYQHRNCAQRQCIYTARIKKWFLKGLPSFVSHKGDAARGFSTCVWWDFLPGRIPCVGLQSEYTDAALHVWGVLALSYTTDYFYENSWTSWGYQRKEKMIFTN